MIKQPPHIKIPPDVDITISQRSVDTDNATTLTSCQKQRQQQQIQQQKQNTYSNKTETKILKKNSTNCKCSVLTGEEPPPHSGKLNHALSPESGPTQPQPARPMSSRHHISMEHRLRWKHLLLNPIAHASTSMYLKEKKKKKKNKKKKEKTRKKGEKKEKRPQRGVPRDGSIFFVLRNR